ncbi:hypothetical protein CC1G_07294 [Coprinopsis cinerea okayama7|uniref:F-box domain-containing protein n=1 Tax=Coprinopsis cinerea (strain Okayama-7 / 130 / ATCC MYA-4618 / FGSC 9003) TaxID=240176 RepID=A8NNL8_COPC7|nr:hypothetical protein CC1G_07294 [Coprinopsis cinerea okayama7\|eukprot:XP_001835152.2 hypothetical protein CC1G_07294 [Coprinopsis cinerea okayama7\
MGNNTSALNGHANSLYPSAIGSFQTSRAFVNPAQSTSMPQFNAGPSKPSFRRPGPASSPPPPPPGAAAPVPGSIYQPTSVPTQVAPIVQGKPRIFAAMGNVDEADPPKPVQNFTANVSQPYPSNQSPNQRPVQATTGYSPPTTTTVSYSNGHHPVDVQRTPRMSEPRPLPQSPPRTPQHHQQHNGPGIQSPPRSRKLSKVRQPSDVSTTLPNVSSTSIMSASVESLHSTGHGKVHQHNGHRTLAKSQPVPLRPTSSSGHKRSLSRSPTKQEQLQQQQQQQQQQQEEQPAHVDEETIRKAGIPLDDDPFAKVEGVKMLKPSSSPSKEGSIKRHRSKGKDEVKSTAGDDASSTVTREDQQSQLSVPRDSTSRRTKDKDTIDSASVAASATSAQTSEERRRERRERRAREKEERKAREREAAKAAAAAQAEAEAAASRASDNVDPELEGEIEPVVDEELEALNKLEEKFFPLTQFIGNPQLLGHLLSFMTFYDWCILSSISREIRIMLVQSAPLREEVLERFLRTDLADYMRGVSTPSHEYARVAKMYVHSLTVHPSVRDPSLEHTIRCLTASTRAYTRVVLRLRAQAEKEASVASANPQRAASVPPHPPSAAGAAKAANNGYYGNMNGYSSSRSQSRPSSRAPSPTMSNYSHSYASSQYGHSSQPGLSSTTMMHQNSSQTSLTFRSPLFRLRRAPLLRVFVPSPEGDWLSDKSVLDCEAECKKAGVLHLMRMGDVVWDIAVGDEGNVGRLVYDGKYLIDLDYTYNPIGDLPKYIPTLAFPPSYFHRVIRTGPVTSNPIAHIDISPWGEEIAANLQLLQDRVKTETPQGAYHNVVRWVHRSSFAIRPPARVMQRGTSVNGRAQPHTPRIPIPETDNLFIDSGWYGTIVVETEGTNEALADLQERCGPRAFPPRPKPLNPAMAKAREENRKVFRILREKSRPGEIWIRAVSIKERLL